MQRYIYYTDKIISEYYSLYLDSTSDQEYFLDCHGFLWESQQAGEILVKNIGYHGAFDKDFVFIKRTVDNINP